MLWVLFCLFLPLQDSSIAEGERFFQDGNYFEAEGYLLSSTPAAAEVPTVGRRLAEIALRMGSAGSKRDFYREAVDTRQGTRRQAMLYALAGLDAQARDWRAFGQTAIDYLNARGSNATTYGDYQLLYYLARYTPLNLSVAGIRDAGLPEGARRWFQACRVLDETRAFPGGAEAGWPTAVRLLIPLDQVGDVNVPELSDATPVEQYLHDVAILHAALEADDFATAAATINDLFPQDRALNRADLRVLFYTRLLQFFRVRNLADRAKDTDGKLLRVRQWSVLAPELLPEELAIPGEWSLEEPVRPKPAAADPYEVEIAPADEPAEEAAEETAGVETDAAEDVAAENETTDKETDQTESALAISEMNESATPQPAAPEPAAPEPATSEPATSEPAASESTEAETPVETDSAEAETTEENEPTEAETEVVESSDEPAATMDEPATPIDMDAAMERLASGQYLEAEGFLLSGEPTRDEIVPVALTLAAIAQRTGNAESKAAFFERYLTRSRNWRAASSLLISALAVHRQDWPRLFTYGTLFFEENRDLRDPRLLDALFYLARYTDVAEENLGLGSGYAGWFDAFRQTPQDRIFPPPAVIPAQAAGGFDYLRFAWILDETEPFELPPMPAPATDIDRFFQGLFAIRQALNADDLAEAAALINAQSNLQGDDPYLQVYFLPLMAEFFDMRGRPDSAKRTADKVERFRNWAVMAPALFDGLRPPTAPEPVPEEPDITEPAVVESAAEPVAEEPVTSAEAATEPVIADAEKTPIEANVGETTAEAAVAETDQPSVETNPSDTGSLDSPDRDTVPVTETTETTFEELERRLRNDYRGLELTIRGKKANTTYKRIYRNYLLGRYYLQANRPDAAFEQLSVASRLIVDYPFPALEMKLKVALADYFATQDNESRESWYRVSAIQIWSAPEHLAILLDEGSGVWDSPYEPLIDEALEISKAGADLSQVIFFSEADHFHKLRRLAFQRNALTDNSILGHQLGQVGEQLKSLVRDLAENPNAQPAPKRYNDTLAIWNQLWSQTLPYYQQMETPEVAEIQAKLPRGGRVLRFVEGRNQLGLMVLTRDQAFSVGLGTKAAFRRLNAQQRFDFLEARLGPIWRERGETHVVLTQSLNEQNFLRQLRRRMARPADLRVHFSLRAFTFGQTPDSCLNVTVLSEDRSPLLSRFVQTLPQVGLAWVDNSRFDQRRLDVALENPDRLVVAAPLSMEEDGLRVAMGNDGFYLHQVVHYNPRLCSLTLVAPDWDTWPRFLTELELVDPSGRIGIHVLDDVALLPDVQLDVRYQGLVLP